MTDTLLFHLYNRTIEAAMAATPSLRVSNLGHHEVLKGDKWQNWVLNPATYALDSMLLNTIMWREYLGRESICAQEKYRPGVI